VFPKVATIVLVITICLSASVRAADKNHRYHFIPPMLEKSEDISFVDTISGSCYENGNNLECKFIQIMIRRNNKHRPTTTSELKKQIESGGTPLSEYRNLFCDNNLANADPNKVPGSEYDKLNALEKKKHDHALQMLAEVKEACGNASEDEFLTFMLKREKERENTCHVNASNWHDIFTYEAPKRWRSVSKPGGICGNISITKMEIIADADKATERWRLSNRNIISAPDTNELCKKLSTPESEKESVWETEIAHVLPLGCDDIEFDTSTNVE
jgi:hypothetical protein